MAKSTKSTEPSAEVTPWTMSVPEAGRKYFGLGKYASYAAAEAGLIPYIQVGRLKRALVRQLEGKLGNT
jgi:hypothetical protein